MIDSSFNDKNKCSKQKEKINGKNKWKNLTLKWLYKNMIDATTYGQ